MDLNTKLRDQSMDRMTDELHIRHKTFTIQLSSYRSDGLWVPNATVCGPFNDEKGKRVIQISPIRLPHKKEPMQQPRNWLWSELIHSFPPPPIEYPFVNNARLPSRPPLRDYSMPG